MREIPANISKPVSLQSFQRELAQFLSRLFPDSRVIVSLRDQTLNKIIPPIEWIPENLNYSNSDEYDGKKLIKEIRANLPVPPLVTKQVNFRGKQLLVFSPEENSRVCIDIGIFQELEFSGGDISELESLSLAINSAVLSAIEKELPTLGLELETVFPDRYSKALREENSQLKEKLSREQKITSALFTFSSIISRGAKLDTLIENCISSLCSALECDSGICFTVGNGYVDSPDKKGESPIKNLEFAGSTGISQDLVSSFREKPVPELLGWAFTAREVVILPMNKKSDSTWWVPFPKRQNYCSTVIVPLFIEDRGVGVMVMFRLNQNSFGEYEIKFASAAGSQLSLAINQHLLIKESQLLADDSMRAARMHAALYRFAHELSLKFTLAEIFQSSFEIMQEELGIQRFWLGLLNEPGTRVIGQAAYGQGWKRKLVEINIDISGQSHPLAEVIKTRNPLVITDVEDILQGLGLKKFIEKHAISSIGLIPLISSGQVLGVLAFEVEGKSDQERTRDFTIIQSFANELATAILSKRLEERVAASETMRAAGLLAAGIAHNFNNLLQGILGQASLLELYSENKEQIAKSSRIISEAATKGAGLVKQLLSFAYLEDPIKEIFAINELIDRNKVGFQRLLKDSQYIRYNLGVNLAQANADSRQIIRIILALLANASEAMESNGVAEIITDKVLVDSTSPHFEVPYGNYVIVGVRDNGVGMDQETKKRCFEPFYTTKNVDPSSGLSLSGGGMGLSAAYTLAKKNGGRLVVDSRKGHGSLFTLYIPAVEEKTNSLGNTFEKSDNLIGTHSLENEIEILITNQANDGLQIKQPTVESTERLDKNK